MNLAQWLTRRAAATPERPALFDGHELVANYRAFDARARGLAAWLQDQGVQPGDRVGIFMKNVPDYLIVFYGIWMAGAAVVPINAKLHGREAAFIIEDAGIDLVFASDSLATALSRANVQARSIVTPKAASLKPESRDSHRV
ncbi:MAG: class I adenylate-forming enzyme family protein [Sulfitobacter sp.]